MLFSLPHASADPFLLWIISSEAKRKEETLKHVHVHVCMYSPLFCCCRGNEPHLLVATPTTWINMASVLCRVLLSRGTSSLSHTAREGGGLLNHPLLTSPDGFQSLTDSTLESCNEIVRQILTLTPSSKDNETLLLFDELSNAICQSADLSECIRLLHPDPSYVTAAQSCSAALGGYVEQLNTSRELYDAVKEINMSSLDPVSYRHASTLLHDFEISGIHLSKTNREKALKLHREILYLSHTFTEQCQVPSLIDTKSAPPSIIRHKHLFSDHDNSENLYIDSVPYLSGDPELRRDCYKQYYSSSHPNKEVLDALLSARYLLARLVRYETFAHRTLADTMAGSPEVVMEFLNALNHKIRPMAEREMYEMASLIETTSDRIKSFHPWDFPLALDRAKKILSKNSGEYFPLSACLNGLRILTKSLYDVDIELTDINPGEVWHDSVQKFAFKREGEVLGILYCDWLNRSDKLASDCQFTIQGGRKRRDGSYQVPISTLSLSFQSDPPLLSQHALENLFHEMGHALHSILGRSPYQNTSGTRCSTDFAEIPSNLMELFLKDGRIISSITDTTGSLNFSSNLFPAFKTQEQILYSVMDQVFHGPHPLGSSTNEIFSRLHDRYSVIPHTTGTAWYLRFTHLYSYAGKYYSYLWSRSVANLIWKKCFHSNPLSRSSGKKYEEAMLMHGGGLHPLDMVRGVLGYEPSVEELVDAYCQEINTIKESVKS